ncbi:CapA family protein [Halobacillus sp. BBL2006]|uniref:CapA family protein n=1 Tax=Halobacillus sp. BBL2006 TaxID=1543706 RepID=UPI0006910D6D|nr:CapA family protein [Halobacillus sp. BBL2006]
MVEKDLKYKMKVWTKKHQKKAVKHSLILLVILSIPFFGHQWLDQPSIPENTRPDDVDFRISMVGDIMLGRHVREAALRSGESPGRVFEYVSPFLDQSDYVTGNFENPIIDTEDPKVKTVMEDFELQNKAIHLYAQKGAEQAIEEAGFDSVNLANNHTMDYGSLSLEETLKHMEKVDVDLLGIGKALNPSDELFGEEETLTDAGKIHYFDADGRRIAILGFTDVFVQGYSASEYVGGVLTNSGLDVLQSRIREANEQADVVMVHSHWGAEYQARANTDQETLAYLMTDMGADVIIGHHPHVLEPVTRVHIEGDPNDPEDPDKTAIVMNSLGNFVFDQGWSRTKDSTMAQLDFLNDGGIELSFVPMQISDTRPRETNGIMEPLRNFRIFRTLRKDLDPQYWRMENDRLIIDLKEAGVIEG